MLIGALTKTLTNFRSMGVQFKYIRNKLLIFIHYSLIIETNFGDSEIYHLHLGLRVTYADVIIVCFYDTWYQLKYFELQCTLQSNLKLSWYCYSK